MITAAYTVWCDAPDCVEWIGEAERSEAIDMARAAGWLVYDPPGRAPRGRRHFCPVHRPDRKARP